MAGWRPNVGALRTMQESLMEDTCIITNAGTPLIWSRTGETIIPCRVGEEHTIAQTYDPEDANTRTMSEWIVTLPYEVAPATGSRAIATIVRQGRTVEGVIGESNDPQTWLIATQVFMTRQVTAVAVDMLTFKRDTNFDGVFETVNGPYAVKVIFDRVESLETPIRYAPSARTSYRLARLVFEDQPTVDVQPGDIFLYQGYYGEISMVSPNQQLRIEAHAWIDFSGIR